MENRSMSRFRCMVHQMHSGFSDKGYLASYPVRNTFSRILQTTSCKGGWKTLLLYWWQYRNGRVEMLANLSR